MLFEVSDIIIPYKQPYKKVNKANVDKRVIIIYIQYIQVNNLASIINNA